MNTLLRAVVVRLWTYVWADFCRSAGERRQSRRLDQLDQIPQLCSLQP